MDREDLQVRALPEGPLARFLHRVHVFLEVPWAPAVQCILPFQEAQQVQEAPLHRLVQQFQKFLVHLLFPEVREDPANQ